MKKVLGQVLCFMNLHDGEWLYTTHDSCGQHFVCRRCDAVKTRTLHSHRSRVFLTNSCTYYEECERCGDRIYYEADHVWGERVFVEESCQYHQKCTRCGELYEGREHQWSQWKYTKPTSCEVVRFCRHCDAKEYGRTEHKWSLWETEKGTGLLARRCSHCGTIDRREPPSDPAVRNE